MEHDALDAHLRDALGISETLKARPLQAALTSAVSYASGAALPLLSVLVAPQTWLIVVVSAVSLVMLTVLGGVAARAGGAGVVAGASRVLLWGAIAMAVTAGIGALFGAVV
jgi:VIT1/CCC1 family predicted Fe2+/Mn2+ transporter